MKAKCRSCGGSRLIRRARLASSSFMLGRPSVVVEAPGTSLLGGPVVSGVDAAVCVDCGAIELQATELPALRRAYEALHERPLELAAAGGR